MQAFTVIVLIAVLAAGSQLQADGRSDLKPAGAAVRSADGRLQVTAAEATTPVRIDGTLDDEVWRRSEPVGGFVQAEPREGQPATEPTDVWVAYDKDSLYIAAYCRDSAPSALVVNDIRKDFHSDNQDTFEVILDTFADRRNGYLFLTNPEGARGDRQVSGEGREINSSWDAVWFVKVRRVDDGWTVEMAIPFKSLRFEGGVTLAWGINFARRIRRKNEIDYWSPVPRAYELTRVSLAGNLAGVPATSPGRNLRVKPYTLASAERATGGANYDGKGDAGFDLKYGVSAALTLDAAVRPDFAQVEADEQQVNLTQFSQFFPEKRDFFLENSGIFYVGDAARNNRRSDITPTPDTDLLLFHSRRIGLTGDGNRIPMLGGARLTGQVGGLGLGALTIQTRASGSTPPTNYTVLRARKNILATSDVGAIFMNRQATDRAGDYNRVYGVDSYVRVFGNLDLSTYFVKTATPGRRDGQYAARGSWNWESNFFHNKGGLMAIGENFNNDMGYYRRIGTRKWFLDTGVRPRYKRLQQRGIREVHPHVVWAYYTDPHGRMNGKNLHNGLTFFFNNGGLSQISYNQRFEQTTKPFRLQPGTPPIPAGGYGWNEFQITFQADPSRPLTWSAGWTSGGLWSGTQRTINAGVTLRPMYRFSVNTQMQHTDATLEIPRAHFVTNLWTIRTNYSFTTNMFLDSLVQYSRDQHQFNVNMRFNLIHRPLSDLFIVFNEQRIMTPESINPGRGLIVKFTRMFAF